MNIRIIFAALIAALISFPIRGMEQSAVQHQSWTSLNDLPVEMVQLIANQLVNHSGDPLNSGIRDLEALACASRRHAQIVQNMFQNNQGLRSLRRDYRDARFINLDYPDLGWSGM